jgi:hypothetical protein
MGLFELADVNSLVFDPEWGVAPARLWPKLKWWPTRPLSRQSRSACPSLSSSLQFLYPRATTTYTAGRASESIRRLPLARRVASGYRRWMPPTVERGPPGHSSV